MAASGDTNFGYQEGTSNHLKLVPHFDQKCLVRRSENPLPAFLIGGTRRRKVIARGEHVYLHSPTKDSAADFLALTTTSESFHHPWVYPATDTDHYRSYLERVERGGAFGFLVARNTDDALVGAININDVILGGFRSGSLGYYAGAPYSGRGYMTEGLALVLDQAFTTLDLHRLEANVQPGNTASLALIRKLGFRKEGFSPSFLKIGGYWCDHERWAMLAEEWLAAHTGERHSPVSKIT